MGKVLSQKQLISNLLPHLNTEALSWAIIKITWEQVLCFIFI